MKVDHITILLFIFTTDEKYSTLSYKTGDVGGFRPGKCAEHVQGRLSEAMEFRRSAILNAFSTYSIATYKVFSWM